MRNFPPECRCLRSFVTSEGMGGTVPSGDEPGPVGAEYGYGYGYGAAGSVMTSFLGLEGSAAASSATAGQRPTGTLRRRNGAGAAEGGLDPGPAASVRHRHRQPGRGITSLVGTDDRDDRTDAHELLR